MFWICSKKGCQLYLQFSFQTDGFCQCALLGVEGKKDFGAQFERGGDVENVKPAMAFLAGVLQSDFQSTSVYCRPIARHKHRRAGCKIILHCCERSLSMPCLYDFSEQRELNRVREFKAV